MKIIFHIPTPGGMTGAPRRLLTLAGILREKGLGVTIASEPDSRLIAEAQAQGIETMALDATGLLSLRRGALFADGAVFRMKVAISMFQHNLKFLECVQIDRANMIWTRGSKGIAFAALGTLLSRRPLIWDVDYELSSTGAVRWLHYAGLWLSKSVVFQYAAAAEKIFGPHLAEMYKHKFQVLVPGIELDRLQPYLEKQRNREMKKDAPFRILQIGTICDRKNQRWTVNAIKHINQTVLPGTLSVQFAGEIFDEKYAAELRTDVSQSGLDGVIEFLGWRDDIHDLMVNADLVVMPSEDEGVPNTVQEAMYIGVPVIVSDVGGMPEVVQHDKTGWVLTLDHPSNWAKQIEVCAKSHDMCAVVGRTASDYAAKHFGKDEWGQKYARVFYNARLS